MYFFVMFLSLKKQDWMSLEMLVKNSTKILRCLFDIAGEEASIMTDHIREAEHKNLGFVTAEDTQSLVTVKLR